LTYEPAFPVRPMPALQWTNTGFSSRSYLGLSKPGIDDRLSPKADELEEIGMFMKIHGLA
jgi:hypothetical protein